jgi:hypothetical protein
MKLPFFLKTLARLCGSGSHSAGLAGVECVSHDGKSCLSVSDGHILCTVSAKGDGPDMNSVFEGKLLARAFSAALNKGNAAVQLIPDGDSTHGIVKGPAGTTNLTPMPYRFPDCEKVFEIYTTPGDYVAVKLNALLLGKLCDVFADAADGDEHKSITLFVKDATSAVFTAATLKDGTVLRGAIMPVAADTGGDKHTFPAGSFPARPNAAESKGKKASTKRKQPAPPPEMLDDDAIAAAVTAEPESLGSMAARLKAKLASLTGAY